MGYSFFKRIGIAKLIPKRKTITWHKVRKTHLEKHPFCIKCKRNDTLTVDHIQPKALGGSSLDPTNLQTLCVECHKIKTFHDFRAHCPFCDFSHGKDTKIYQEHLKYMTGEVKKLTDFE